MTTLRYLNPLESANPLEVISYFATSLYDKFTEEEIFWDIAKNCIHRLALVDCVIYQLDHEKNCLIQKAAYGLKNPMGRHILNRIEIPVGVGIVGAVAKTGKSEFVNDTTKDHRYIKDEAFRCSELAVPIIINDKVVGVIDSEHPEKGFFTLEHEQVFTILATLCSQKIQTLKKERKKLTKENEHFQNALDLLGNDKIYRNPDISLQSLSVNLGISPTYLSYLINDVTENGFSDFINKYRVEEVKRNLFNSEYEHYTILSIGLESGFNSKTSFNTAFKKFTGYSPSVYRKEN